jgi:Ca-activated chloride channel homolog
MRNMKLMLAVLSLTLAAVVMAGPIESESDDKTLSPYFVVKSDDPSVDQLPLLSTSADVNIAGVIADVKVTQVYKNDGKRPIEAIYVFPASTRAAVYGMKMTIGDRTLVADIRQRDQARKDYEAAKQAGKSASLLEQQRPNVFQMNVANIMPGDKIKVELSYTELLVPTDAVYEFAYPTVVGPRYSNKPAAGAKDNDKWVANPYQHQREQPLYTFDIKVNIAAGLPIQEMTCPSHKTNIGYDGANSATVNLDASEKSGGNRDFILKYRLAGGKIQSGLLRYEGKDENFFLVMLQPPKRVESDAIPPREYIFIMDVSGSMNGYPIDISKKLLRDLITNLRPSDKFNLLLFAGGNSVLSEKSLAANEENIQQALQMIDHEQGGGGTELLPALKRALALPRSEGTSRSVVIATDGYVDVEPEAFDVIRENLGKANMFAFGIGTSVNRLLIEGMAHVGMGEPFVIAKSEDAQAQADKFRAYIKSPVLTQIKADFDDFDAYDVEPLSIPDVLAERPIIVFGKYRLSGLGEPTGSITISGRTAQGKYEESFDVASVPPVRTNSALRFLWARHRIQVLSDYNNLSPDDKRIKEVTDLGLKYSLLTQYTSFVAIDSRVRNKGGEQETVTQPLPLPEGVSDLAVGGGMGYGGAMQMSKCMTATTRCMAAPLLSDKEEKAAPPIAAGVVKLGKLEIKGGLPEKEVRTVIEGRLGDVRRSYNATLKTSAGLNGKIVVKFTIQPDGSVGKVETATNELNSDIESALVKLIASLHFTNLASGIIAVTVPFIFEL